VVRARYRCMRNRYSYHPRKRLAMKGAAEMPMGMPQIWRTKAGPKAMKVEGRIERAVAR
jgi:hypothetical protein